MNQAVTEMLNKYNLSSLNDYENALKEIIQEIALLGLWRSKFFEKAAFYGGSALRILYGLDRFSEDLDFSLLKPDKSFSLSTYCKAVEDELKSFNFSVSVRTKEKKSKTNIDSAFIKAGTLENLLIINTPVISKKLYSGKLLKIKLEVDVDPPGNFLTEARFLLQPVPFSVNTFTLPCLFAGKMHSILCRSWKGRVKGRDWYDLVWYIGRNVSLNLNHLEERMKQTGHLKSDETLTGDLLRVKLLEKIKTVNFDKARQDVKNFLKDSSSLALWSDEFFIEISKRIKFISE